MEAIPPPSAPTVRVTLRRRHGQALRSGRPEFAGNLQDHFLEGVRILSMRTGLPSDADELVPPDLYEPVVVQFGGRRLRIRGFESIDGVGYVQEWLVDYLP